MRYLDSLWTPFPDLEGRINYQLHLPNPLLIIEIWTEWLTIHEDEVLWWQQLLPHLLLQASRTKLQDVTHQSQRLVSLIPHIGKILSLCVLNLKLPVLFYQLKWCRINNAEHCKWHFSWWNWFRNKIWSSSQEILKKCTRPIKWSLLPCKRNTKPWRWTIYLKEFLINLDFKVENITTAYMPLNSNISAGSSKRERE